MNEKNNTAKGDKQLETKVVTDPKNGVKSKKTVVTPAHDEKKNANAKKEKKPTKERDVSNGIDQRILEQMRNMTTAEAKEFTSTQIRDKLGLDEKHGRGLVRRHMRNLADKGKVAIVEKKVGNAKHYVYCLKE